MIFPDTDLKIYDYNRFVSDLNGLSEDQFLVAVNKSFDVTRLTGNEPFRPKVKGEIGMYLNHAWYKLTAHDYLSVGKGLSDRLDVSLLQDHVQMCIRDRYSGAARRTFEAYVQAAWFDEVLNAANVRLNTCLLYTSASQIERGRHDA